MTEQFFTKEFPNALTLVAQRMDNVSSAAMMFRLPAGAATDPSGSAGAAAVAVEWCLRGAGDRDSRALNDALDSLGCQHHEAVGGRHMGLSATVLGRNLTEVLAIYADIILRPTLGEETFEPCRDLVRQDLASLEDQPARKCNVLLQEKFYPSPLGRCPYGTPESLEALTPEAAREHIRRRMAPGGSILSVAGNIDFSRLCDAVEEHFGAWCTPPPAPVETSPPAGGFTHIRKDSAQTHIALAHRSVPIRNEHYYAARVAETILSAGMSSRLFTEVREKRGLVYHVSSRYHSLKDHAAMLTYAGTVPEKAQETFDVTVGELRRLAEGVTDQELARAKTQLKSSLIMQGESTAARAGAIAGDWYHLGRLRGLKELSSAVDAVTEKDILAYLRACPARDFTILIIGPDGVDTSGIEN